MSNTKKVKNSKLKMKSEGTLCIDKSTIILNFASCLPAGKVCTFNVIIVLVCIGSILLAPRASALTKFQKSAVKTNVIESDKAPFFESGTRVHVHKQKVHKFFGKGVVLGIQTDKTQKSTLIQNVLHQGSTIVQKIVTAVKNTFGKPQQKIVRNTVLHIHPRSLVKRKLRAPGRNLARFIKHKQKKPRYKIAQVL